MTTTCRLQLDTSGEVDLTIAEGVPAEIAGGHRWSDLSPFTQGYIEALFAAGMWGQSCTACAGNGEVVTDWDRYLGAPEPGDQGDEGTADCPACDSQGSRSVGFSDLAPETLARIIADCDVARTWAWSLSAPDFLGREFWRLRQEGRYGERFPPLTVQLGDDGKVRFTTPARSDTKEAAA